MRGARWGGRRARTRRTQGFFIIITAGVAAFLVGLALASHGAVLAEQVARHATVHTVSLPTSQTSASSEVSSATTLTLTEPTLPTKQTPLIQPSLQTQPIKPPQRVWSLNGARFTTAQVSAWRLGGDTGEGEPQAAGKEVSVEENTLHGGIIQETSNNRPRQAGSPWRLER